MMKESASGKKAITAISKASGTPGADAIAAYSQSQAPELAAICETLRQLIEAALTKAESKIWHAMPVWFLDDNPVVGYKATAKGVQLMFWNGQAFGESVLKPVGQFRAAQVAFATSGAIDAKAIKGWLKKAGADVLDSKVLMQKRREGKG